MSARFWSYSDASGFERHETAEQARAAAEQALDWHRDESSDGWAEEDEVTRTCWGEIREAVVETARVTVEQAEAKGDEDMAGTLRANGWDYHAEYDLRPVGGDL